MDEGKTRTQDDPRSILRGVDDLDYLFYIFEHVNCKDMRIACLDKIQEQVIEADAFLENLESVAKWYTKTLAEIVTEELLENMKSSGHFSPKVNATVLILFRGAMQLDYEVRKEAKSQWEKHSKDHYNPSRDLKLLSWERNFTKPIIETFCKWIEVMISLRTYSDLEVEIECKEKCIVALCGALKYEKRRYNNAVRRLFTQLIEKYDKQRGGLINGLKEKVLTRVFKAIALVTDVTLLEILENSSPTPGQVYHIVNKPGARSPNTQLSMEQARWTAIMCIKGSV
ncbi:MAG: hypothetical protein R3346_03645 [Candidatus Spechtbacterales bacterium]|nr:hypothetical protein [Candidatus Spechtbacterales bacterium]